MFLKEKKIGELAVTLTGTRALAVRGGDGGRDSTGSDVGLLAIPRSPYLLDRDSDACARIRFRWNCSDSWSLRDTAAVAGLLIEADLVLDLWATISSTCSPH